MAEDPAKTYKNPVVNYSLPDPSVIRAEDGYFYLYATEDIRNLPIHRSKDLIKWESVGTAFTDETRPTFEPKGNLWHNGFLHRNRPGPFPRKADLP